MVKGYITSWAAHINLNQFGYRFYALVQYSVANEFCDEFVEIILKSTNILTMIEVKRDVGFGSRFCTYNVLYANKSQKNFLKSMKQIVAPIPFNVEYQILEVSRVIKRIPAIELSLGEAVNN